MEPIDPGLSDSAVGRAIEGQREAVTELTRLYLPRVYGLAFRLSRNRELADEATQEAFVRVLKALPNLRRRERIDSWVLTIAANTTRSLIKQRSRTSPLEVEPTARLDLQGDDARTTKSKAVDRAVAELRHEERSLFLLHTIERVPIKDLAREQKTTPGALKARMHRIRAKVRVLALCELEAVGADL